MFGFKGMAMMIVVVAVMAGGFFLYYKDTQKKIATLISNNAKLETAVQSQKATIVALEENFDKQSELITSLSVKAQEAEAGYRSLSKKLRRHDMEELSRAKPGLMENKINNGTKKLFDELENITSAPKPEAKPTPPTK
ncbi:hypothetical protein [uncultured virus]|uniref:I-spanin n=1 Tax=uncultured virus TaxID=340016 RepID=A0A218MKH1_9VIRU|nr:hypothetical protein [uncultured virus]